ncbi:MAG TPA: histidine kinase [Candidatus Alistipes stercoravium]|nr:histidine kinase [Candidatus Alistipes stercoravium]
MRIRGKQAIGENLLYVMVWSAIILVPVLNSQMMSEMHINLENVLIAWRQIAPYLIIFVIHNSFLAPRYMLRRKYGKYLILNIALITTVFFLVDLYEEHLLRVMPEQPDPETIDSYRKVSFSNLEIYWNIVLGFFMTGANTGIKLIYQSMRDEQKMEALQRQNLQAEMDYLKYQINPHFFMNTLNNIHALIDFDTDSAKSAVIELSKMMRYVLYDSGREIISLNRDIQFLKNYIELMRIRYTDDVDIRMEYPENLPESVSIPPLLLIVFIENAFKHGVSYNRPSYIHLKIEYADGMVTSTFENSRHSGFPERKSTPGIGLENVRKRLALIYGEKNYSLEIRELEDSYTVKLVIPTLHA